MRTVPVIGTASRSHPKSQADCSDMWWKEPCSSPAPSAQNAPAITRKRRDQKVLCLKTETQAIRALRGYQQHIRGSTDASRAARLLRIDVIVMTTKTEFTELNLPETAIARETMWERDSWLAPEEIMLLRSRSSDHMHIPTTVHVAQLETSPQCVG